MSPWLQLRRLPPYDTQPVCRVDRAHTTASSPTATLLASCLTGARDQGPAIPRPLPALSRDSAASLWGLTSTTGAEGWEPFPPSSARHRCQASRRARSTLASFFFVRDMPTQRTATSLTVPGSSSGHEAVSHYLTSYLRAHICGPHPG